MLHQNMEMTNTKPKPKKPKNKILNLNLTKREKEVLLLSAEGHKNEEIADKLHLSPDTIETHASNIIEKLLAKNMKNAIAIAFRNKVIE